MPAEILVVFLLLLPFVVLALMLGLQKPDTTTSAEIAEATQNLRDEINKAEIIVGRLAPHNAECRRLLVKARYCLQFNKNSTRRIVSAATIKRMRLQGIDYAKKAATLAESGN